MSGTVPEIDAIEKSQLRDRPAFRVGDTINVHFRIREGEKERIQVFKGVRSARSPAGSGSSVSSRSTRRALRSSTSPPAATSVGRASITSVACAARRLAYGSASAKPTTSARIFLPVVGLRPRRSAARHMSASHCAPAGALDHRQKSLAH
jgi:hypothetical protein